MATTQHIESTTSTKLDAGAAALWASAFVILAMIIVQAGRVGAGNQARASVTAEVANLRLLTSLSSQDEEILTILDQSQETLSAYAVISGRTLEIFDMIYLPDAFAQASGKASGRR